MFKSGLSPTDTSSVIRLCVVNQHWNCGPYSIPDLIHEESPSAP